MKKSAESGINLFAGFSSATASQDKALFYNPDSPYTEGSYYELKNLIEKCAKKSQNTKLKSMARISAICEETTDFTLFVDLLPNWIFLFGKIVRYDSEKSVRENAFRLQGLFFTKFKTKFVNFIHDVFTPLWLGRNDPCKEVAETAKKAFTAAFPENRHVMVIEKCMARYITEIAPILSKQLQESEEILERLMSCALLGIKDALNIAESIKPQCLIFLEQPTIWSFIEASHRPLVRCAGLLCFDTFLSLQMLSEENLAISCPIIFSLISDKNRLIQQVLWGQVLLNLMEKFPIWTRFVNTNKVINDISSCAAKGASGAGPTFYMAFVKVFSLIDKEKLQDKKLVEATLIGLIKGLSSEEGGFHGKYALNAFYEVLLYFYLKLPGNNSFLDVYFTHPVALYLSCTSQINANSYVIVVPALLSQTLGFLETKGQLPDISSYLFQLISTTLTEKVEIAIDFLQELAKNLGEKGPSCRALVSNLLYTIHAQLSQDIDNKIVMKDFSQLALKLPLFRSFSEITMKYASFEPKVLDWWIRSTKDEFPEAVLKLLADVVFLHPQYWTQAIEFSLNSLTNVGYLIPEKYELQLLSESKTLEFLKFPIFFIEKLQNSENLSEITKCSVCLQRLFHKDMILTENLIETVNEIIAKLIASHKNLNEKAQVIPFLKTYEFFSILSKKLNENSAVLLGEFFVQHGWKNKLNDLWELCKQIPGKLLGKVIESGQAKLVHSLVASENWENLITVAKKMLSVAVDKRSFLEFLLVPEIFASFYDQSNSWLLFNALIIEPRMDISIILESNLWLLAQITGFDVVPCLINSLLLSNSLSSYIKLVCNPLIREKSSIHNLDFIQNLNLAYMDLSRKYSAYRVVLIKYLKFSLYIDQDSSVWSQAEVLAFFNFFISNIQDDPMYTILLCDVIYIFKSILCEDLYIETLEKWQKLAYARQNEVDVRIYAACIPDNYMKSLATDLECLNKIIEKGLRPTDLSLVLSIVRRGGFEAIPQLEQIELLVISILLEGKDLHEVLPYVQRLLSSPEKIFNKEQVTELIINLPLHNPQLNQPEIVEISETLTRMFSIADEQIDEESLFRVLYEKHHIGLSKSVYSLLEYSYSQFEVAKTKVQAIPEFAEKIINHVPNVKCDVMESQTFSYILAWMLLIEKYRSERYHREKKKEGISEFMVCFKDLLENSSELVTVFLTTLMAYLHDESELDINFNVSWTEILNEDSCAKFCCLALYKFLSTFPSLGRSWWLGIDRFLSNSVQKVVKKLISNVILAQEIRNIENRQIEWKEKNINIVSSKAARDITAVFTKSEFSVQVSLQIPADYPLSPPEPTVTKKVKIGEEKVRRWLLSMVQLLQQENSTILELLLAWKEHVERELEGIEDCFICYYLVHPTDKSLPNLPCQVCGNKFHKLCIQKWFNSSHNATCPLCRNPFRS